MKNKLRMAERLKAFHGDGAIKQKYLARVRAHRAADEIIKGKYWKDGKGCAVGCTIHSDKHDAYESELGIPEWLARVEDTIFEGLPNERAKLWPEQFLSAINPGADLDKVKRPFLIFVLRSALQTFDHTKFPEIKNAIDNVIALYEREEKDIEEYKKEAARAEAAARAVAWAVEAARAAWAAAWAAWAAEAARAEAAAWAAAWAPEAPFTKFADELLRLLLVEAGSKMSKG